MARGVMCGPTSESGHSPKVTLRAMNPARARDSEWEPELLEAFASENNANSASAGREARAPQRPDRKEVSGRMRLRPEAHGRGRPFHSGTEPITDTAESVARSEIMLVGRRPIASAIFTPPTAEGLISSASSHFGVVGPRRARARFATRIQEHKHAAKAVESIRQSEQAWPTSPHGNDLMNQPPGTTHRRIRQQGRRSRPAHPRWAAPKDPQIRDDPLRSRPHRDGDPVEVAASHDQHR